MRQLWAMNLCPHCGRYIPEGTRVGTGQRENGGFCSLDCFTRFHAATLLERAILVERVLRDYGHAGS